MAQNLAGVPLHQIHPPGGHVTPLRDVMAAPHRNVGVHVTHLSHAVLREKAVLLVGRPPEKFP